MKKEKMRVPFSGVIRSLENTPLFHKFPILKRCVNQQSIVECFQHKWPCQFDKTKIMVSIFQKGRARTFWVSAVNRVRRMSYRCDISRFSLARYRNRSVGAGCIVKEAKRRPHWPAGLFLRFQSGKVHAIRAWGRKSERAVDYGAAY